MQPILGRPIERPTDDGDVATDLDTSSATNVRARIIGLLGPTPVAMDDLVRLSESPPALVRMTLLELEVAGRVIRRDGGLVALL